MMELSDMLNKFSASWMIVLFPQKVSHHNRNKQSSHHTPGSYVLGEQRGRGRVLVGLDLKQQQQHRQKQSRIEVPVAIFFEQF